MAHPYQNKIPGRALAHQRYASGGTASPGIATPAQDLTKQGVTMPIQAGGASGLPKGPVTPAKVSISKTMKHGGSVKKEDGGEVASSSIPTSTRHKMNTFETLNSGIPIASGQKDTSQTSAPTIKRGGKIKGKK